MKGSDGSWTSVFGFQIFHSLLIRLCFVLFQCPQLSSEMGAGLPESGSRGLQRLVTFHVVIASDSFYSEQIVFHGLMGLSCSNLGSDEFCFHLERKVFSNRVAGSFRYCCFLRVLVCPQLRAYLRMCSGTVVHFWQQVLNSPEDSIWSLPRFALFLVRGRERSPQGQGALQTVSLLPSSLRLISHPDARAFVLRLISVPPEGGSLTPVSPGNAAQWCASESGRAGTHTGLSSGGNLPTDSIYMLWVYARSAEVGYF